MMSYSLVLIAAIAFTYALMFTKAILIPFVFAVFLYSTFSPLTRKMELQFKIPHWLAVFVGVVLIFISIFGLLILLGYSITSFSEGAFVYKERLLHILTSIKEIAVKFGFEINAENLQNEIKNLPIIDWAKNLT
ncbi:MAG: AI-2E family transporter, partial [Bdellovibrionales bacterium]|nr:AI-2E family transporter [Bdellovibrionales bacterium]